MWILSSIIRLSAMGMCGRAGGTWMGIGFILIRLGRWIICRICFMWRILSILRGRRYIICNWGIQMFGKTDAASGRPSPTQTGQRSGELIAKGGISPIRCEGLYFARSGKPSRAASLRDCGKITHVSCLYPAQSTQVIFPQSLSAGFPLC